MTPVIERPRPELAQRRALQAVWCPGRIERDGYVDLVDPGDLPDRLSHPLAHGVVERAAWSCQGHHDPDPPAVDVDAVDQTQVHDRQAELGIEDVTKCLGDLLAGDRHARDSADSTRRWRAGHRCPSTRPSAAAKASAPS